jgi:hypothetical protein
MNIFSSVSRFTSYYTRHGFGATIRRARLAVKRALFSSRMVLFYCDLSRQSTTSENIPRSLKLERLSSYAEISSQDLQDITSFWNPKQANRNIRERFNRGTSLWLVKSGDRLAGYGWTMRGGTMEPHYFPLAQNDAHLFDFHVFPQFRGQGINPLLVTHILSSLAGECSGRAYIEAAEWNEAQLSSLRKTPFCRLGMAKKLTMLHRTMVFWDKNESVVQIQKDHEPSDATSTMAMSHKQ